MKKQKLSFSIVFVICCLVIFSLIACDTASGDSNSNDDSTNKEANNNENNQNQNTPAVYNGFYNYPTGRVDPTGKLTVQNQAATDVLLFNGSVTAENYLGTVNSLGSVILKMSDEKFYSIVAVEKSIYEEKAAQAPQTSSFTYYSNILGNKVNVTTSKSSGNATWIINNPTSYWASFTSTDKSQTYAVIAPGALRVSVPIEANRNYFYFVSYTKEITFNGRVVAVVETDSPSEADIAVAKEGSNYQFKTDLGSGNFNPSGILKPSILVRNNLAKGSILVNKSTIQLTNGANTVDGGLAVIAGESQLYVGLEAGDNINTINFENMAWTATGNGNLFVKDDFKMENGKLYIITLSGSDAATRSTSVEVVDAEAYFEANK